MNDLMITTIDNPFDYYKEFDDWNAFDVANNHNTLSLIARLALVSPELSDEENEAEINRAIEQVLEFDYEGIYKRIAPSSQD